MSKKLFSKVIVFLLVVGLLFAVAPTGQAQAQTTLCVNTDGADGCYTSIQSAITAASTGNTITVAAGTYTENITINKALTLQGAGRDLVTLTGITTGDSAVVSVSASDVTIQGFSFQAPLGGKKVVKIIAATSGFHFLNNRVTTADNPTNINGYAGLETDYGLLQTDHVITGNIFVSNHTSQMVYYNPTTFGLTFTGNQFIGTHMPNGVVLVFETLTGTYDISGNSFADTLVDAYSLMGLPGLTEAQMDAVLAANTFPTGAFVDGIDIRYIQPIFVDDDFTNATVGWGVTHFDTIQDGIAAVGAGGTVNVYDGVYNPPATITLDKAISIIGPTTGEAKVIGAGGATNKIFNITRSNVTIQHLTLTLALAPTANDALINATEGTAVGEVPKTNINILDNKIYVDPQAGAIGTWFGQAIYLGRLTTESKVNGNTIYNTRSGLVVAYQSALEIKDNVIYNTKGGIMNYTGTAEDAAARVMTNNSWGTVHNEWDIVWNSGGGPYDLDENVLVLGISQSNNDAYVVSLMPTAYTTPPQLLYSNRSHVFVNATTGTETIHNANGNINLPYKKIQDAIDAVVPGGKVIVASGTYYGPVVVNKALTLVSTSGAAATIIHGGATTDSAVLYPVVIRASDVVVNGFTVTNPMYNSAWGGDPIGIAVGYYGDTLSNIRLTNNIITEIGHPDRSLPTPQGDHGSPQMGICVNAVVTGLEIDHNTISDLVMTATDAGYGGPVGIAMYGYGTSGPFSTGVNIHNNTVEDLSVTNLDDADGFAIGIMNGWGASDGTINLNIVRNITGDGIRASASNAGISTITNNTVTNANIGVNMNNPLGGVITGNTISGNGTGIQLGSTVTTAPTITGNAVNMVVLQLHDGSTGAVLDMPTVYGANTWALYSIISGRDILVPAPVHNVTKDTYFSTIQAAIDDSGTTNGDVIVARPGTYIENVNVNKEVTLLGARDLVDFSLPISLETWYVDRYAPAIFESANVDGEMVLRHGVRAPAQPGTFNNNQGRGYDLDLTGTSQTVSIDLFVDTGWTSGQQSAGLWGVGMDSTPEVSAYPILAWRNVTGETPGFYTFDYINGGYYLLKAAEAGDYGKWHTLTFTLTPGIGIVYSVDGVTGTFADPDTVYIKSLILNVYNFGVDYDVLWDNLLTSSVIGSATIQGLTTINANNVSVDGFTLTNPNQTYGMLVNSGFAHIDITNNVFENIGATTLAQQVKGIHLQNGPDDVLIEGNTFRNIHASTKSVNAIYAGDTAATNPTQGLIIRNNSFFNLTSIGGGGYGILFNNKAGTEGVVISGNTFDSISGKWTHAIGLEGPTPGASITGNTFSNLTSLAYETASVFFEDNPVGGTVQIEGNKFLNLGFGVLIHPKHAPYTYTVDASPNYWGSACGPTAAGANVGQNVTYAPWYTDEDLTTLSAGATTYNFTSSNTTVEINATIACAAPGSTFNFAGGGYTAGFVVPLGRDHMTLVLADGVMVTASSPCFDVSADYTTITAEHIGMAACVTAEGSNGIDVADGIRNLTVDGLEIYGLGNDGIHFSGVIRDVVLKDNYIHNLAGNGVFFGAQPVELTPGGIDIHGNLFKENTGLGIVNSGTTAIDATYNSWGDVAGPAAGDGVGPHVTATPYTHVDVYLVASGTPWTDIPLNQVVSGQTITFKVMAHVVNALTVDVKLAYPTNLTDAVTSAATSAFPALSVFDTDTANVIGFYGMAPFGTDGYVPVTGDVELFTVTFKGGTPGLNLPMNLDDTSDVFGMEGAGSSSNIYAVALVDSTVNVIDLPVIDIVPVSGQTYIAGLPIEFNVVITNLNGANYADIGLEFETGASDYVEFLDTDNVWKPYPGVISWGALATNGTDLTPVLPLFRVTFFDPGVNTINLTMLDRPTVDDIWLDDTFEDFTLLGNFTITGTFSMQGRSTRAGIPVTLTDQEVVFYTDKTGTTINQISFNLSIENVNGGNWMLTTLQPRYLNVITANGKIFMVDGNETLNALQLLGGNAVWVNDNVIDVNDASQVGTDYGNPLGVTDPSTLNGDCNFDGKINVQDLALVGGNYGKTSETAYGVGGSIWLIQ